MKRLFNPFVLVLTAILFAAYTYVALRLTDGTILRVVLGVPFVLVWLIPVLYWSFERQENSRMDHYLHFSGYLSMGWLSFLLVFTILRDVMTILTELAGADSLTMYLHHNGGLAVLVMAASGLALGAVQALNGPSVREVEIPVANLHPDLEGLSIVQISDLHVGPTIKRPYVDRVVEKANSLMPDLVVLTGDIVDGSLFELTPHVEPLLKLKATIGRYFIVGNHEYYSGADAWIAYFQKEGFQTLLNAYAPLQKGRATVMMAGVLDPAAKMVGATLVPDPELAMRTPVGGQDLTPISFDFKILLAHNPKIAPEAAKAGYDLQLSGHTHAGQFFPWTLVTRLVHAPHFFGLSRSDKMWVYVSAGTGTWGPPVRLGTKPELTLIRLVTAKA